MSFEQPKFEKPLVPPDRELSASEKERERISRGREGDILVTEIDRFGAKIEKIGEILEKSSLDNPANVVLIKDLKYKTKEGKTLSFNELLPREWGLLQVEEDMPLQNNFIYKGIIYPSFHWLKKEYIVPEGKPLPASVEEDDFSRDVYTKKRKIVESKRIDSVSSRGFFLRLLHEIGHAQYYDSLSEKDKEMFITIVANKEAEIQTKRADGGFPSLSEQEKKYWQKEIIPKERKAWAWALKNFRKFRQEGVDLEPTLPSNEEILKIVHAALSAYEKDMDKDEYERALAVFWGESE